MLDVLVVDELLELLGSDDPELVSVDFLLEESMLLNADRLTNPPRSSLSTVNDDDAVEAVSFAVARRPLVAKELSRFSAVIPISLIPSIPSSSGWRWGRRWERESWAEEDVVGELVEVVVDVVLLLPRVDEAEYCPKEAKVLDAAKRLIRFPLLLTPGDVTTEPG